MSGVTRKDKIRSDYIRGSLGVVSKVTKRGEIDFDSLGLY